jgi:dTDP-glucose 4,6-dehydratase
MITHILAGKLIPVYGDGRQIRDWLYVDDHNQGVDLILASGRPGHDRRYAIDATKIQTELGYTPKETIESGLQKTLNWYIGIRHGPVLS